MFISASANAINMVSFLKVWSSKSAHYLVVHIRSYLAPSLFLTESLKKVPNIQQCVHDTTPPSAVSVCMARPDHVAKQCFVTVLARPVVVSALRKKETFNSEVMLHLMSETIRLRLDANVKKSFQEPFISWPFFQVLTPEFGHGAWFWVKVHVLGH